MEDPYGFAESLDRRTEEYAESETAFFRKAFGKVSEDLRNEVSRYYVTRRILDVRVTEKGILRSYTEDGAYHVAMDSRDIYSTENLIFWIEADRKGERIAVFETGGSDSGTLTIISNGETVEVVEGNIGGVAFTDTSYYMVKTFTEGPTPDGGEQNSHRVLHNGEVVFGQGMGPEDFITLYRSGEKMFAVAGNWSRSKVYCGDTDKPESWELIREADYPVTPLGARDGVNYFLDGTSRGKVMKDSQTLIESDLQIESAMLCSEGILTVQMQDGKAFPVLYDMQGRRLKGYEHNIPLGLRASDSDGSDAVLCMHSFGIPYVLFRLRGMELEKVEENALLDPEIEETFVESGDARVHVFLINPSSEKYALAYGYGGFNVPVVPSFMPVWACLINHGITVAVANLRGGSEYGEEWHRAGMKENKQNVFDDFQSVIRMLTESGRRVIAYGVSNGGLLTGTTLTQSPELLAGAVIGNPVLDMMRYHRLSVGRYWVPEYGDPDVPGEREYLMKYSPYHNIGERLYPPTLIYTRMKDDRVHPAHAIKFHMALKKVSPATYLRVNPRGGHIGITVDEMVSETSDICAFMLSTFAGSGS